MWKLGTIDSITEHNSLPIYILDLAYQSTKDSQIETKNILDSIRGECSAQEYNEVRPIEDHKSKTRIEAI